MAATVIQINAKADPAYALVSSSSGVTLEATQTVDFSPATGGFYPVNPGAGNVNANLPAASASGAVGSDIAVIEIKNVSTNVGTVTVVPAGADTIDGVAGSIVLAPQQSVRLVSDGVSNWMTAP